MRLLSIVSLAILALTTTAGTALAGRPTQELPEPGTLGLLAAGAVGVAYLVRKRRK